MELNIKNILTTLFITVVGGIVVYHYQKNDRKQEQENQEIVEEENNEEEETPDVVLPQKREQKDSKTFVISDGLVGYYRLDGNTYDSSNARKHGENKGVSWIENRFGTPRKAGAFNGKSYIRIKRNDFPENSYTKTAWVKKGVENNTEKAIYNNIISGEDGNKPKPSGHAFGIREDDGFRLIAGHAPEYMLLQSSTVISTKKWYFVTVSYDFNDNTMKLYLDGELIDENDNVAPVPICKNLYIGEYNYGANHFTGIIDDVRIYNRSLSDSEIMKIYAVESENPQ